MEVKHLLLETCLLVCIRGFGLLAAFVGSARPMSPFFGTLTRLLSATPACGRLGRCIFALSTKQDTKTATGPVRSTYPAKFPVYVHEREYTKSTCGCCTYTAPKSRFQVPSPLPPSRRPHRSLPHPHPRRRSPVVAAPLPPSPFIPCPASSRIISRVRARSDTCGYARHASQPRRSSYTILHTTRQCHVYAPCAHACMCGHVIRRCQSYFDRRVGGAYLVFCVTRMVWDNTSMHAAVPSWACLAIPGTSSMSRFYTPLPYFNVPPPGLRQRSLGNLRCRGPHFPASPAACLQCLFLATLTFYYLPSESYVSQQVETSWKQQGAAV